MSRARKESARKQERLKLIKERYRKLILEPKGRVVLDIDADSIPFDDDLSGGDADFEYEDVRAV